MRLMKRYLSIIFTIFMFLFLVNSMSVEASSSLKNSINKVELSPTVTGYAETDQAIAYILASITTPKMTTYQKVKACYDYLINNCSYGFNTVINDKIEDYFAGYDGEIEAYGMLTGHVGVCDDYSAAFVAMMRTIGLNSYMAIGQTHKASGGYTYHVWAIVKLNGVEYIFDPQIDDNIAKGGKPKYYRFGKTYKQMADKYVFEAISDRFVPFDHTDEQYLKPHIIHY